MFLFRNPRRHHPYIIGCINNWTLLSAFFAHRFVIFPLINVTAAFLARQPKGSISLAAQEESPFSSGQGWSEAWRKASAKMQPIIGSRAAPNPFP